MMTLSIDSEDVAAMISGGGDLTAERLEMARFAGIIHLSRWLIAVATQ
jgi:hypothetical protein